MTVIDSLGTFISEKVFTGLFSSTYLLRTQESREGTKTATISPLTRREADTNTDVTEIGLFFFWFFSPIDLYTAMQISSDREHLTEKT